MAVFPQINGQYYSYSDIALRVNGLLFVGVKAINYSDSLSRQKARGTARVPLGLTAGRYEAQGDFEMYPDAFQLMLTTLGAGVALRQIPISFSITYGPNVGLAIPLINDLIPAAYIGNIEASNAESDEPLSRKFTLIIPGQILWNGAPTIIETSTLQAVA